MFFVCCTNSLLISLFIFNKKKTSDKDGEHTVYKPIKAHERHLKFAKEMGDRAGEGEAYGNLSNPYESLVDYQQAFGYHIKHLKIAKEIGDRAIEGPTYGGLIVFAPFSAIQLATSNPKPRVPPATK